MTTHPLHVPEEQMTWRARAYLCVGAMRHLALGVAGLILTEFNGSAFKVLFEVFPLEVWSVLFLIGGVHLAYAAGRGSVSHARVALIISASMTAAWAMGFNLAAVKGAGAVSTFCGILFSALVLKDLVQCGQPLRSPFEPIVRKYVHGRPR